MLLSPEAGTASTGRIRHEEPSHCQASSPLGLKPQSCPSGVEQVRRSRRTQSHKGLDPRLTFLYANRIDNYANHGMMVPQWLGRGVFNCCACEMMARLRT